MFTGHPILDEIKRGCKLRPTVTNDKSRPAFLADGEQYSSTAATRGVPTGPSPSSSFVPPPPPPPFGAPGAPPPPPMAPMAFKPPTTKPVAQVDRGEFLRSIQGGVRLKKTVVNDRSGLIVDDEMKESSLCQIHDDNSSVMTDNSSVVDHSDSASEFSDRASSPRHKFDSSEDERYLTPEGRASTLEYRTPEPERTPTPLRLPVAEQPRRKSDFVFEERNLKVTQEDLQQEIKKGSASAKIAKFMANSGGQQQVGGTLPRSFRASPVRSSLFPMKEVNNNRNELEVPKQRSPSKWAPVETGGLRQASRGNVPIEKAERAVSENPAVRERSASCQEEPLHIIERARTQSPPREQKEEVDEEVQKKAQERADRQELQRRAEERAERQRQRKMEQAERDRRDAERREQQKKEEELREERRRQREIEREEEDRKFEEEMRKLEEDEKRRRRQNSGGQRTSTQSPNSNGTRFSPLPSIKTEGSRYTPSPSRDIISPKREESITRTSGTSSPIGKIIDRTSDIINGNGKNIGRLSSPSSNSNQQSPVSTPLSIRTDSRVSSLQKVSPVEVRETPPTPRAASNMSTTAYTYSDERSSPVSSISPSSLPSPSSSLSARSSSPENPRRINPGFDKAKEKFSGNGNTSPTVGNGSRAGIPAPRPYFLKGTNRNGSASPNSEVNELKKALQNAADKKSRNISVPISAPWHSSKLLNSTGTGRAHRVVVGDPYSSSSNPESIRNNYRFDIDLSRDTPISLSNR